jgi:glycine cleavage system pyridoxal-binding protein P
MTTITRETRLAGTDDFVPRHIGPSEEDIRAMLDTLGYASLD